MTDTAAWSTTSQSRMIQLIVRQEKADAIVFYAARGYADSRVVVMGRRLDVQQALS